MERKLFSLGGAMSLLLMSFCQQSHCNSYHSSTCQNGSSDVSIGQGDDSVAWHPFRIGRMCLSQMGESVQTTKLWSFGGLGLTNFRVMNVALLIVVVETTHITRY